ncbi:MAG: class I SAM-dependent methyltransferase [Clostridiales bacterium]|jgi:SAM-dependent methyltransferase|nr:class I SAM-dependent methyltransferase [Clostridiales bacterium]
MSREHLRAFINETKGPILEIGPFTDPFLKKGVYDVSYADIRSKDEIYEHYLPHKLYPPELLYQGIVPIDYVIKDTYKNAVEGKRFSLIFSSHVIEHVDDIIAHFKDLWDILEEGGYIALVVPDKRYTFDHFREVTPFRDMIDVYLSGDTGGTARFAFDMAFTCHPCNSPALYTDGNVGFNEVAKDTGRYEKAVALYKRVKNEGYKVGDHNWVFTYASFLAFVRDGLRSGLLPFTLHYSHPPLPYTNEFTAILKKDSAVTEDHEKRMAEIIRISSLSDNS